MVQIRKGLYLSFLQQINILINIIKNKPTAVVPNGEGLDPKIEVVPVAGAVDAPVPNREVVVPPVVGPNKDEPEFF
jgi:hypothetical protein